MKATIDDTLLAAIEQAGAKASERPWEENHRKHGLYDLTGPYVLNSDEPLLLCFADANFICLAANHALYLVAEVRRLYIDVADLRDVVRGRLLSAERFAELMDDNPKGLPSTIADPDCAPEISALADGDYTPEMIEMEREYREAKL